VSEIKSELGKNISSIGCAMDGRRPVVFAVFATISLSGCAHTHLRWNTTHQATTLTDIYEQQVLDNLARFVVEPGALPSFAYPNAGAAEIAHGGAVGGSTGWDPFGFVSQSLNLGYDRRASETWTLEPIYDVRRLELMRCAYQHALFAAGLNDSFSGCPNCDKLQRMFYLGSPSGAYGTPDTLATWTVATGRTTPACFAHIRWVGVGPKKCVPKEKCIKVGHYCGTYVWVCPGGQEELTKLTLTILDYAFVTSASPPGVDLKEVTWYFKDGVPSTAKEATSAVRAAVAFDSTAVPPTTATATHGGGTSLETPGVLPMGETIEAGEFGSAVGPSVLPTPIGPQPSIGYGALQFELQQQYLAPSRRSR
jgi:hypothetical protein